jgi:predicted nucleotidyltransferase
MISKADRKILNLFSKRVREQFPNARIWAFGSRARGTASWDSDFDTCIVVDKADNSVEKCIRDIAWVIGFENEVVITTVILDANQFEDGPMSESTLVQNILREGLSA